MNCPKCGLQSNGTTYCVNCGEKIAGNETTQNVYQTQPPQQNYQQAQQTAPPVYQPQPPVIVNNYVNAVSNKSRLAALLLAIFLGPIGVHRFYAGKVGTGLLWLFTGGLFGVGYIVDIIMIAVGSFSDSFGRPIINW